MRFLDPQDHDLDTKALILRGLAADLEFDGRGQIELRFHDLDSDLIW